jgi:hypothetical protein
MTAMPLAEMAVRPAISPSDDHEFTTSCGREARFRLLLRQWRFGSTIYVADGRVPT